ncbi:MAG: type II secretion system protein [Oscillospiraceae bacterium]
MKKLTCKKGMTLVEVIVSIAIVSIVSVMMATGFLTVASLIRRGQDLHNAAQQLTSKVENATVSDPGIDKNIIFSCDNGKNVSVKGRVIEFVDDSTGVCYNIFVPY